MTIMTVEQTSLQKLRAPQNNGHSLVHPPFSHAGELITSNRESLNLANAMVLDSNLSDFAVRAKSELVKIAIEFTGCYLDVSEFFGGDGRFNEQRVVLSGHQPDLFHPGVWFKNFALDRLAKEHDAIGINLLIDNDLAQSPGVNVLSGSIDQPSSHRVLIDASTSPIPYEERAIRDLDSFCNFPQRVKAAMGGFSAESLDDLMIDKLWPLAIKATKRSQNLGKCLAEARHRLEAELGLENLEVPLSRVCETQSFLQFFAHVINHAERFRQAYNSAIREYRITNRLRSETHPAPVLQGGPENSKNSDWIELPFWGWRSDVPNEQLRRNRVFFRSLVADDHYELSLGDPSLTESEVVVLPCCKKFGDVTHLQGRLKDVAVKIRPRALMTTMYARLALSDLFIHGIGGAKYDVVTDKIIGDFFDLAPPRFVAASATFRLPFVRPIVDGDDLRQINGLLRDLWYHPEQTELPPSRPASEIAAFRKLQAAKRALIDYSPPRGHRKSWHDELSKVNQKLRDYNDTYRSKLLEEKERLSKSLRNDRLLSSREFSFCLFPYQSLTSSLSQLASAQ